MTISPTETIVLDDEAIAEIEARRVVDHHLENGAYIGCYILLSTSERDALCQTVRVLRERDASCAKVLSDRLRNMEALGTAFDELHAKNDELQSQLEQTEARLKLITEDRNLLYAQTKDLQTENERLKSELRGAQALDQLTDRYLKASVQDTLERLK